MRTLLSKLIDHINITAMVLICALTCEKAYYKDIITYLITKKVKFAYSLDGGHSTKLIIDGKQINYFKFNRKGRKYIPSVIEFKLQN